jgi:uncharacterized protein YjbI with pentapeptide repeats
LSLKTEPAVNTFVFIKPNLFGYRYGASQGSEAHLKQLLDTNECKYCSLTCLILEQANLRGANLNGVHLEKANLKKAVFSGAELSDANLFYANLEGADLKGTRLCNTTIHNGHVMNSGSSKKEKSIAHPGRKDTLFLMCSLKTVSSIRAVSLIGAWCKEINLILKQ